MADISQVFKMVDILVYWQDIPIQDVTAFYFFPAINQMCKCEERPALWDQCLKSTGNIKQELQKVGKDKNEIELLKSALFMCIFA